MNSIKQIIELIDKSIKIDAQNQITSWNIIQDWYNSEVDKYKKILSNSNEWLINYQNDLSKTYNIPSLKIKYTNTSLYFIEVLKSQISKIPDFFILRQTLINASRYTTIELKNFELEYINASDNLSSLEYSLFNEISDKILESYNEIKTISEKMAYLDFWVWLAINANENDYIKPEMTSDYDLIIESARHPILEKNIDDFISNDLSLTSKKYINIITWPNMWGKSTYLRQNALIVLLAHIWSYVPAKKAIIPIVDRIFSRVWANDNIFLWQSTFMVEMQEVANILNNSTSKSFVIIDEIWRWTSTYDGMSLAWAILKENHDKIKAKTLFSTHYHELIDKSDILSWVKNYSMSVWNNAWEIIFLRKIVEWWIKKSYWLEVAKLAWINKGIIEEAKKMLLLLEKEHNSSKQLSIWDILLNIDNRQEKVINNDFWYITIYQKLKNIDINNLTPIESLNFINELKTIINENK